MNKNAVCAIVVTFRPDDQVLGNISELRTQVETLLVIDNGSSPAATRVLEQASVNLNFVLLQNCNNLGLPAALNIGIRWAHKNQSRWVMYFDQDSRVTKEYVKNMLAEYAKQEHPQKIGIIAPSYIDKHTGEALPNAPLPLGTGQLSSAWTSGSLMSTSLACKVGGFEEQLTIDLLDYEFSLRLRSKGYNILQCSSARLLHSPGHPKSFRFLGKDWFTTYNHQPARTYYLVRNRIWILRKYGGLSHRAMFPNLRRNDLVSLARHSLYLLIAEKSRWQKLCFIVKGAYDGIIDRMGKTVEL